jgi:hypothetical protein
MIKPLLLRVSQTEEDSLHIYFISTNHVG